MPDETRRPLRSAALRRAPLLLFAAAVLGAGAQDPLTRYRDQRRVLLIFAPAAGDPRLKRQRVQDGRLTSGPDDRDLVVVETIGPGGAQGAALRRRAGAAPSLFQVVLMGKDGGVKLRSARVVAAERLAAVIDAMPMRREEMSGRAGPPAGKP